MIFLSNSPNAVPATVPLTDLLSINSLSYPQGLRDSRLLRRMVMRKHLGAPQILVKGTSETKLLKILHYVIMGDMNLTKNSGVMQLVGMVSFVRLIGW